MQAVFFPAKPFEYPLVSPDEVSASKRNRNGLRHAGSLETS